MELLVALRAATAQQEGPEQRSDLEARRAAAHRAIVLGEAPRDPRPHRYAPTMLLRRVIVAAMLAVVTGLCAAPAGAVTFTDPNFDDVTLAGGLTQPTIVTW